MNVGWARLCTLGLLMMVLCTAGGNDSLSLSDKHWKLERITASDGVTAS